MIKVHAAIACGLFISVAKVISRPIIYQLRHFREIKSTCQASIILEAGYAECCLVARLMEVGLEQLKPNIYI